MLGSQRIVDVSVKNSTAICHGYLMAHFYGLNHEVSSGKAGPIQPPLSFMTLTVGGVKIFLFLGGVCVCVRGIQAVDVPSSLVWDQRRNFFHVQVLE